VWSIAAALSVLFMGLIIAAPLALARGRSVLALAIYRTFSGACHQIPERSFYLDGHPLAVCARCTGIYLGFAVAVLLYPLVRSLGRTDAPARRWLLIALAPTLIDFALGFSGLWQNTHFTRSLTGALLGAATAFYVLPGLVDLGRLLGRSRSLVEAASIRGPLLAAEQHLAPSDYGSPANRI
jgi:uncharacterized membrane protein